MRASFAIEKPSGSISIFDQKKHLQTITNSPKPELLTSIDITGSPGIRVLPDQNVQLIGHSVKMKRQAFTSHKSFAEQSINKQSSSIKTELLECNKDLENLRTEEPQFLL